MNFDPKCKSIGIGKVGLQLSQIETTLFCDGIVAFDTVFGWKRGKRARVVAAQKEQDERENQSA